MKKYIHDKTNGIDYELVGDYYLPCLKAPESPKVGRFGMLYHDYLRKHKRVTYSGLILSGKLKEQIEEVDRQAEEMFSHLVDRMKQTEGVTEQLKATDQFEWVRRMNSIRNRAEEIVKSEVLFTLRYLKTFGTVISALSKNLLMVTWNTKVCFVL